jgi:hypothetical protein
MAHDRSAQSAGLLDTMGLANHLKPRSEAEGATADGPSPRTIERWRSTGRGPAFIKVGRRVLYRREAIESWLDQQTRSHTNQTDPHKPSATKARARQR